MLVQKFGLFRINTLTKKKKKKEATNKVLKIYNFYRCYLNY